MRRMDDEVTDVAHWQRSILDGDEPERGPAYYLFEASTTAFSALLQILAADSTRFKSESYESLRDEFRKFYMWNEGFSTRSGDLDYVLSCSKNLKATVIGLMVHWVKAVSKGIFACLLVRSVRAYRNMLMRSRRLTFHLFTKFLKSCPSMTGLLPLPNLTSSKFWLRRQTESQKLP